MCNYFHSRNAYLYQEAAPAMSAPTGITETPSTETLHSTISAIMLCQTSGMQGQSQIRDAAEVSYWLMKGKMNKINNPHRSQKVFTRFFLCPATQTSKENTSSVPSSPIPSKMFLLIIAFKLDCTMWLSFHHLDQPENSLLILILYLKLEESFSWLSLFLD